MIVSAWHTHTHTHTYIYIYIYIYICVCVCVCVCARTCLFCSLRGKNGVPDRFLVGVPCRNQTSHGAGSKYCRFRHLLILNYLSIQFCFEKVENGVKYITMQKKLGSLSFNFRVDSQINTHQLPNISMLLEINSVYILFNFCPYVILIIIYSWHVFTSSWYHMFFITTHPKNNSQLYKNHEYQFD